MPTTAVRVLPGLIVTAVAVYLAVAFSHLFPAVGPLTGAVVLGALLTNSGLHRRVLQPGTRFAARRLLRFGVVVLGLQLAVPQVLALGAGELALVAAVVAATFFGTWWLAGRLGLSDGQGLLVATGFAVCGAAAIAAMDGVTENEEDEVITAVALVTICGTLAIVILPLLAGPLGLSPRLYGAWVGASVHEVSQVVAAATPVAGALAPAVVIKLTRVVLLAPMVAGMSVVRRRRGAQVAARRPPLIPLFVLGFLAMVGLRTAGIVPAPVLHVVQSVETAALAAALFGLGTGVHLGSLRRTGARALALGFSAWLLVAVVAYAGVRLVG